jgi:hypothetical protein
MGVTIVAQNRLQGKFSAFIAWIARQRELFQGSSRQFVGHSDLGYNP